VLTGRRDRNGNRKGDRWWLLLVLLLAVTATVWVTRYRSPAPAHHPAAPQSSTTSGSTAASTAACRSVNLEGIDPATATAWRKAVEPVHRAACAGDFTALARLLGDGKASHFSTSECTGCDGTELVDMWRQEYRFDGSQLARALETRPVQDQGGLTYHRGDTLVIFARGTFDFPVSWSAFFMDCHGDDRCRALAPATDTP
jgi:hypothetical protein